MILSPDQAQALRELHAFTASHRTRHALSGPAGSGKTYLVGQFLSQTKLPIRLSATTHKAAKVAARMSPDGEASTVHSLLGLQPEADHKRGRMVLERKRRPKAKRGDLVIVDEASMVDSDLLAVVDQYASEIGFRVLYVGDNHQLPPIFESVSPAFDKVPTSHLTTIHRQALDNPLIATATGFRKVLDGAPFPVITPRAPGVYCASAGKFESAMLNAFATDDYRADSDFCRAIAWTNRRVVELNRVIRRRLVGPAADRYPFTEGEQFIVNEAVKQYGKVILPTEATVTVLDAAEGTIHDSGFEVRGVSVEVEHEKGTANLFCPTDRDAAKALLSHYASKANALQRACKAHRNPTDELDKARREAWKDFFSAKERMSDLRPPHACTVHKSQGSTFQHAFIDIGDIGQCTRSDIIARLTYVALTRPALSALLTGELPPRCYPDQRVAA
ncbi:hypothetical protein CCR96_19700 [Halochromatium roseum]|nr:hypothetical protein [Halochromatium roseum]